MGWKNNLTQFIIEIKKFLHILSIKMTRIYVGGLHERVTVADVEREFEYFGRVRDVWVARNPPGFAFMVFDNPDDAHDAIKDMDGRTFKGTKIRVEISTGGRGGGRGRGGRGGG